MKNRNNVWNNGKVLCSTRTLGPHITVITESIVSNIKIVTSRNRCCGFCTFAFSAFIIGTVELIMFYVIGIGLGDAKDITVKGLEIIKEADVVFLESYTSILSVGKKALEDYYGRELILADRELVEQGSDEILSRAKTENVAFLVVGDPFGATTHADILLRAKELGIETKVVHNASIMNAVGCCGLQLYNFGETVSIPFWTDSWQPDSFYDKICNNKERGLHSLCLLDIKVKEPTPESIMKKKKEYLPPHFMTVSVAAKQILEIIRRRKGSGEGNLTISDESECVGLARVGSDTQKIISCSLKKMADEDIGTPLHSLVVVGNLHPLEEEFLQQFRLDLKN